MTTMPTNDELWPPQSAKHALLSSPSGRRKFADFQSGKVASPLKSPATSLTLLDRMRRARKNEDEFIIDDEEYEDEETLRLKLAAIEAKLKLKKLQNKAKRQDDISSLRPESASDGADTRDGVIANNVEVGLSPIKRPLQLIEPRSPSRVVLGIDKGLRGADISLRRPRTTGLSPVKDQDRNVLGNHSRASTKGLATSAVQHRGKGLEIKSFSERMAEVRDHDRLSADKKKTASQLRTKNFRVDAAEMEHFKTIAENVQHAGNTPFVHQQQGAASVTKTKSKEPGVGLRKAKTLPDLRGAAAQEAGDATLFEGFSRTHLSTRILPHSFLKRTLPEDQYTTYRIPDLLKVVVSPAFELPDDVGDYVVFGVIASKSSPLNQKQQTDKNVKSSNAWEQQWDDGSQNRKKFIVMTLTDLKWTIDLYLFDTAVPRYHRLSPGTVIAVLNPSIMPPKKGKENTGAFSLALHNGDDTVLEIGTSSHLGFCKVEKKNGHICGQWVNAAKTEICEWHLNAEIAKTQARRMGVNTGGNGFGKRKANSNDTAESKSGRGYDWSTDSHYYITSSSSGARSVPTYNPAVSTARMLDGDDPFVAEGQFSRDKEALIKKRLASQEKEREIAKRLANFGSGTSAGANYMRKRAHGDTSLQPSANDVLLHPANIQSQPVNKNTSTVDDTIHDLKSHLGKKRTAQDVHLSPVKKKTRFLTDHGIKVAGRESLGSFPSNHYTTAQPGIADDDDDLDIV